MNWRPFGPRAITGRVPLVFMRVSAPQAHKRLFPLQRESLQSLVCGRFRHGKVNAENRSHSRGAFDVDFSPVQVRNPARDRESQTGSSLYAISRFVFPTKTLEYVRKILFGDSYALPSALRTLSGVTGGAIHFPIAFATAQTISCVVAIAWLIPEPP